MKAADRLGAGSAFGAMSARNKAKAQAQGDIPMYDLVTLPLDDVVPTPLNPRRNFGSTDELLTLGHGLAEAQLQPCVAVPAAVYLRLWPEHTEQVGSVGHVLLNGERRWRAGREAGLEKLDFTLRSDLAVIHDSDVQAARARLLDAVLKENIDRKNFDPIEEARGVAALVAVYGDGVRAGQQLNRGKAWVSQRLTLLALPADLQDEVSTGRVSIDDARWMGARAKKDPELTGSELLQLLKDSQEQQRAERKQAAQGAAGFTAVNPAAPEADASTPEGASSAVDAETVDPTSAPSGHPGFTAVNPGPKKAAAGATPDKVEQASAVSPRPPADPAPTSATNRADADSTAETPATPNSGGVPAPRVTTAEELEALADDLFEQLTPEQLQELARIVVDRLRVVRSA